MCFRCASAGLNLRSLQGQYSLTEARLQVLLQVPALFSDQGHVIVSSEEWVSSSSQRTEPGVAQVEAPQPSRRGRSNARRLLASSDSEEEAAPRAPTPPRQLGSVIASSHITCSLTVVDVLGEPGLGLSNVTCKSLGKNTERYQR